MSQSGFKAILFDLDDTLYVEQDYYISGFKVVGEWLERQGVGRRFETAALLLDLHLREGRERVFQKLANRLGFPSLWIPKLVQTFRFHTPRITLPPDTASVLPRLRETYRLGCITDGWAEVQWRKIKALKVESLLDAIVVADDLGREFWKPHAQPFRTCCALLGAAPDESIFVGDNLDRDMIGAWKAGMRSVRMRRAGSYFEQAGAWPAQYGVLGETTDLHGLERMLSGAFSPRTTE